MVVVCYCTCLISARLTPPHHALVLHPQVAGLPTNLAFLQDLSAHPAFIDLDLDTGFIERHRQTLLARNPAPDSIAALAGALWAKLQVRVCVCAFVRAAWQHVQLGDGASHWLP